MLKPYKLVLRLQSSQQLWLGVVEMFYDGKTFHDGTLNVQNILWPPFKCVNIFCGPPHSAIVP